MAQDYNEYLAANVLNEQQFVRIQLFYPAPTSNSQQVSYRLLGRALKVHANLAKQYVPQRYRRMN